jgi:hypothetical protein
MAECLAFSRTELEAAFSDLDIRLRAHASAQREIDRKEATQFTIFKFIEVDENVLSDMLAFLLDPAEAHGQQEQFLQLFVRRLGHTPGATLGQARVAREALTYSISKHLRRIDVLVTAPGLVIAIENKVDAEEGDEQLDHYHAHVEKTAPADYCLVFLTPRRRRAESLKPATRKRLQAEGKLVEMSYVPDLRDWLRECVDCCESAVIRHVLKNLLAYIAAHPSLSIEP